MKYLIKSKRGFITLITLGLWLICVLVFDKDVLETATALSLIAGIYGLSESLRPSIKT